jgi:uncharacterized protein (DUF2062 family)
VLLSWRGFRERARGVLHLDEEPSHLAAAMAVGVFIGFTPFYGLHTLIALVVAFLFRLNKVAIVTGAWINLPWFAPFIYAFCLRLGEALLSGNFSSFSWASVMSLAQGASAYLRTSPRDSAVGLYRVLWDMLFVASKPLFVGTLVVGLAAGAVTYFVTLEAIRDVRRLRHRRRPGRSATGGLPRGSERTP